MDLVSAHQPHPAPRPCPPRRGAPVWQAAATPPRARVAGRGAADRGLDGEALVEGKCRHAQAHLSRRPGARGDRRACARWSARAGRMLRALARAGKGAELGQRRRLAAADRGAAAACAGRRGLRGGRSRGGAARPRRGGGSPCAQRWCAVSGGTTPPSRRGCTSSSPRRVRRGIRARRGARAAAGGSTRGGRPPPPAT
jgi:hypothetical protein